METVIFGAAGGVVSSADAVTLPNITPTVANAAIAPTLIKLVIAYPFKLLCYELVILAALDFCKHRRYNLVF